MASFIVINTSKYYKTLTTRIIKQALFLEKDEYNIYEFDNYNKSAIEIIKRIQDNKVYILSEEGEKIAKKIRDSKDYDSIIIILTSINAEININNLLVQSIIKKDDNFIQNLYQSIIFSLTYLYNKRALTINSRGVIYKIPLNEIYFIEKNLDDEMIYIHMKNKTIKTKSSIKKMETSLNKNAIFFKCHRACIINIFYVDRYNKLKNELKFKNGEVTNLISRERKKLLFNKLCYNINEKFEY